MTTSLDHPVLASGEAFIINEPRLWVQRGWTEQIIKNGDDDGWAVEMILDGQPEPALMGPWTMGWVVYISPTNLNGLRIN